MSWFAHLRTATAPWDDGQALFLSTMAMRMPTRRPPNRFLSNEEPASATPRRCTEKLNGRSGSVGSADSARRKMRFDRRVYGNFWMWWSSMEFERIECVVGLWIFSDIWLFLVHLSLSARLIYWSERILHIPFQKDPSCISLLLRLTRKSFVYTYIKYLIYNSLDKK